MYLTYSAREVLYLVEQTSPATRGLWREFRGFRIMYGEKIHLYLSKFFCNIMFCLIMNVD